MVPNRAKHHLKVFRTFYSAILQHFSIFFKKNCHKQQHFAAFNFCKIGEICKRFGKNQDYENYDLSPQHFRRWGGLGAHTRKKKKRLRKLVHEKNPFLLGRCQG